MAQELLKDSWQMFQLTLRKFMATCSNLNSHPQPWCRLPWQQSGECEGDHSLAEGQAGPRQWECFINLAVKIMWHNHYFTSQPQSVQISQYVAWPLIISDSRWLICIRLQSHYSNDSSKMWSLHIIAALCADLLKAHLRQWQFRQPPHLALCCGKVHLPPSLLL